MKTIFTCFLLIYLLQIPNIFAQNKSKWTGQMSLGSSLFKGEVNNFELNTRGSISHADSAFEYSSTYKIIYGETDHKKNNQDYSAAIKFDLLPKSKVSPFVVATARQNRYRGYELQLSFLAGLKYSFIKKPSSDISLSAAIQYDIEKYPKPIDVNSPILPQKENLRLSIRPKIKQKIGSSVYIENITFIRPSFKDFKDYRFDSETTISNKLTQKLFLNLNYDYELNNKPPQTQLVKENMSFTVSLAYRF
jgi:putative salt-induced outer membrane protein YdiY